MTGTKGFRHSEKQTEIMNVVLKAADDGQTLSAEEIRDRVNYGHTITVNAMICSLGFLARHGFVQKQSRGDGTRKINWAPTSLAYAVFRPTPLPMVRL